MVVVAARRDEQRPGIAANGGLEPEHTDVERLGGGDGRDLKMDVADPGASGNPVTGVACGGAGQNTVDVERKRRHLQLAARVRPLLARTIAVDLDPVALGVVEVERLRDEVIGRAREPVARARHPLQRPCQVGA